MQYYHTGSIPISFIIKLSFQIGRLSLLLLIQILCNIKQAVIQQWRWWNSVSCFSIKILRLHFSRPKACSIDILALECLVLKIVFSWDRLIPSQSFTSQGNRQHLQLSLIFQYSDIISCNI